MKTLILPLILVANFAFGQATYYLHTNSSSITIQPNQLLSRRSAAAGGVFNTALGEDALRVNIRDNNTAVGHRALYNNSTGAVGSFDGVDNTAVGIYSLFTNTLGNNNVAIGRSSLYANTIGYWNIAVGSNALDENQGGYLNVAMGYDAIGRATSANYNTAIGTYAMRFIAGGYNTAVGGHALAGNGSTPSNGDLNVAIGYQAAASIISGSQNVAVGYQALGANASGTGNVAIGYSAGGSETGSGKLYIDNSSTSSPLIGGDFSTSKVGINRSMANIAARAENFQVEGGGYFTGAVTASCGIFACSDIRYKTNILRLQNSLSNILKINGVSYFWKQNQFPERGFNNNRQIGVIAQELEQIYPEMVMTDEQGYKTVDYSRLAPVLIEAIKELNERVEKLDRNNEHLKTENAQLKQNRELIESRLQRLEAALVK